MINQCRRVLKLSNENDIIICWGHMTGLYLNYFLLKQGSRKKIILMNWLTPVESNKKVWQKKAVLNLNARILVKSQEQWEKFLGVS